jgi:hypothetical protein
MNRLRDWRPWIRAIEGMGWRILGVWLLHLCLYVHITVSIVIPSTGPHCQWLMNHTGHSLFSSTIIRTQPWRMATRLYRWLRGMKPLKSYGVSTGSKAFRTIAPGRALL